MSGFIFADTLPIVAAEDPEVVSAQLRGTGKIRIETGAGHTPLLFQISYIISVPLFLL